MKIAITAESTIDLPKELLEKHNIKIIPFDVLLGDVVAKDGEITPAMIFEHVKNTGKLPKTSAINTQEYTEFFQSVLASHDQVIHFAISSGASCSFQNAKNVDLENVFVVDSKSLSAGIACLALTAKNLANNGFSAEEIVEKIEEIKPKVHASFVVDRLDYLFKGGRCSTLQMLGANLLKLKPEIEIVDGVMGVKRKFKGKMEKVMDEFLEKTLQENPNPDLEMAFIPNTTTNNELIERMKNKLLERGFKTVQPLVAGATITSHCGENTIGVMFINK